MTTKTISTYYAGGYSLNAKYSRLTITATGGIGGTGLYAGSYAQIFNHGFVHGAGGSDGVRLAAGGLVQNGSAAVTGALIEGNIGVSANSATVTNFGTIHGVDTGVSGSGGSVTNGSTTDTTALIQADVVAGVSVYAADPVNNFGTISGVSAGVDLLGHAESVTNGGGGDTSALIQGDNGVHAVGTTTVVNLGTILGTGGGSAGRGVLLDGQGSLTNGNVTDTTAEIRGSNIGAYIVYRATLVVTNFGTIDASGASAGSFGVYLYNGGNLTNGSSADGVALIAGYVGVGGRANQLASPTVVNFGTITGTGEGPNGVGVDVNSGSVINGGAAYAHGLIQGYTGVEATGGTVINFATIQGTGVDGGSGVYLNEGQGYVIGVFNGSATITSALIEGYNGIQVASYTGSVTNYGTIESVSNGHGAGVFLSSGGSVKNGGGGDIVALIEGSSGVIMGNGAGSVVNFATIDGATSIGVDLMSGGSVTNGAAGDSAARIEGYIAGVSVERTAGSVANFGTIVSDTANQSGSAINLFGGGQVQNGTTLDAGALLQGPAGIFVAGGSGTIANFGAIVGTYTGDWGIFLTAGGSVTNGAAGSDTTALIQGYDGILVGGGAGTVANFGTIAGTGARGVKLRAGGSVVNGAVGDTTALIETAGFNAVSVSAGYAGSVINFGTIEGAGGGVYLGGGGRVINGGTTDQIALISGYSGVFLNGSSTVVNFGTIRGTGPAGTSGVYVYAGAGSSVTNGAAGHTGAIVEGFTGVTVGAGAAGTVTNFGTIIGTGGTAIDFGSSSDELVVEAGSVFVGSAMGGGGTLVMGSGVGTISGVTGDNLTVSGSMPTTNFTDFGILDIAGGARFTLLGGAASGGALTEIAIEIGATLLGSGTIATVVADAGTVIASGGALGFTGMGDSFGGTLGGTQIDFAGGTDLLLNGSKLTASVVGVSGGAVVTLAVSQAYSGKWTQGAGTVQLGGHGLTLTGSGSTIAGTIGGAGALVFGGGTQVLNSGAAIGATTWSISGGAAVTVNEALTYAGTFSEGAGTKLTVNKGDKLMLTGASTFAGSVAGAGTVALSGGKDAFNAGASVSVGTLSIASGAVVTVNTGLTDSGALSQASGTTIALGANTLTLTGTGSALAGSMTGTGTLAVAGGTAAINLGASLTVSHWSLTGGTTTINESLTYKGAFTEAPGAILTLTAGDKLTLTGATSFGGLIHGGSRVTVSTATASGLTIGGTVIFEDSVAVNQTGTVTVGDKTTSAATLTIDAGATWTIAGGGGIGRGSSTKSAINENGTLTNSEAGTSVVAVKVVDTGSMTAAVGTLDFTKGVSGTGAMSVNSGATLEADLAVGANLSMTFNGGNAILALKDAKQFAATINGFAATDTIDLLGKTATSATLNGSDQLVIKNGTTTIATLQLAGTYTGDTFNVASDGAGGTNVTVSTGAAVAPPPAAATAAPVVSHQFIAAMAGLGAGGGAVHLTAGISPEAFRPVLSAPRMQMA